jgi:hypothetical protein
MFFARSFVLAEPSASSPWDTIRVTTELQASACLSVTARRRGAISQSALNDSFVTITAHVVVYKFKECA